MMIFHYGDLIAMLNNTIKNGTQPDFYAAHGCNCQITQGAGIAGALRKFPEVYQADVNYGRKDDPTKLGEFSMAPIYRPGESEINEYPTIVFNLYTQLNYQPRGVRHLDYDAVYTVFDRLFAIIEQGEIWIPKIGSDLAGGDWEIISFMINHLAKKHSVLVHVLDYVEGVDPRDVGTPVTINDAKTLEAFYDMVDGNAEPGELVMCDPKGDDTIVMPVHTKILEKNAETQQPSIVAVIDHRGKEFRVFCKTSAATGQS
ncbi:phosphatase [Vibrio phage EniLVp02]